MLLLMPLLAIYGVLLHSCQRGTAQETLETPTIPSFLPSLHQITLQYHPRA